MVGNTIKNHLVLDYDLWRVMVGLIELIQTPIQWEKVDSHIEGKIYRRVPNQKEIHNLFD